MLDSFKGIKKTALVEEGLRPPTRIKTDTERDKVSPQPEKE